MQLTFELNMYIFTCRVCCNPNLLEYKMKEAMEDNSFENFFSSTILTSMHYLVEFELTQKLSFLMYIFPVTNLVQLAGLFLSK